MKLLGREPAFWIGLIVTLILGVISTLSAEGVISLALAGKVTDTVTLLSQLLILLAPIVTGLLIRSQVTPIAAPALPSGTTVTVITPTATPNTTTTL